MFSLNSKLFNPTLILSTFCLILFVQNIQKYYLTFMVNNETCPFCYGSDLCNDIKNGKINLKFESVNDILNLISTKNVYRASYNNTSIYLKKLAYSWEIRNYEKSINRSKIKHKDIITKLNNDESPLANFKLCTKNSAEQFIKDLKQFKLEELWTILHLNVEPLLLAIFNKKSGFPVPKVYGYCGKTILQEDRGISLINFEKAPWLSRAYIALQLLEAAVNFTCKHSRYRLYLTDMSPDNIVVQPSTLKISFIDLENALITIKMKERKMHSSINFADEYSFNSNEICQSTISDHNIFSVCKLFLSKNAPWPMRKGGLLHNPPISVFVRNKILFKNIEFCKKLRNHRFYFSKQIMNLLHDILYKINYKF